MALLWASQGHHVKFVSVTNGDIGHWRDAGGPLARRRKAEVEKAARVLGIATEVLDIHDGELLPTLDNRRTITRLIREWKADIVMSHRPNDYHPDHRYTGVLVQDSAYMVAVPNFCPDVPPLKTNPVFFFYSDSFQKPNPFQPDVVVSIDPVIEKKLDALDTLESQFYEGGALGSAELMPADPEKQAERRRRSVPITPAGTRPSPGATATSWPSGTARTRRTRCVTPRRSRSASTADAPTRRSWPGCSPSSGSNTVPSGEDEMDWPTYADVVAAADVVRRHLRPTPLYEWPALSRLLGCRYFLKHENHTPTTAFKVRGGLNLVSRLSEEQKRRGIIAAPRATTASRWPTPAAASASAASSSCRPTTTPTRSPPSAPSAPS